MNSLPRLWLRLRLALVATNPVAAGAFVLGLVGAASLAWLVQASDLLARQEELARRMAARTVRPVAAAPAPAVNENLALFQAALGERRYVEQQVKVLFGLAAKTGLVLHEGDYKLGHDPNARIDTYEVSLPVKGSYGAIWQFAMLALRAIPFASLDDISFKRDAIGTANVEARLRLTLYLARAESGAGR
jgi:hypothetical protein